MSQILKRPAGHGYWASAPVVRSPAPTPSTPGGKMEHDVTPDKCQARPLPQLNSGDTKADDRHTIEGTSVEGPSHVATLILWAVKISSEPSSA